MMPWGHVAVAYLCYSTWQRTRGGRPGSPEVFVVAGAALVPDLVDKPLAWTLGVLESGRSLGHSWLVAAFLLAFLWWVVAPRVGREAVVAFAIGYLSHGLADVPVAAVLSGDIEFAFYFLWPVLAVPPSDSELSLLAYLLGYEPGLADALELGLVVLAASLWHRDDRPGLRALRGVAGRRDR